MPFYFLDVCNIDMLTEDTDGRELPNLEAARRAAITNIRSILSHEIAEGRLDLRGEIRIRGGGGGVLRVVPYADAIEVRI